MIKIDVKLGNTILKKMTYANDTSICEISNDINVMPTTS